MNNVLVTGSKGQLGLELKKYSPVTKKHELFKEIK